MAGQSGNLVDESPPPVLTGLGAPRFNAGDPK
jgi:hypothetical protein